MDYSWTSSSLSNRYPFENTAQADMNFLRKFVTGSDRSFELNNRNPNDALGSLNGPQRYQKLGEANSGMDSLSALIAPKPYSKQSSSNYHHVASPSNIVRQIQPEVPQRSMSIPPSVRFDSPLPIKSDDIKFPLSPGSSSYLPYEPVYEKTFSRHEAYHPGETLKSKQAQIPQAHLPEWMQKEFINPLSVDLSTGTQRITPVEIENGTLDRIHSPSHPMATFDLVDTLKSRRRAVRLGSPDYDLSHRTANHATKSVKFADDIIISKLHDFSEEMEKAPGYSTAPLRQFPTNISSPEVHEPVYASVRGAHNATIMTSSMYDNEDSCDGILFASPAIISTTNGGTTSSRTIDSTSLHVAASAPVQQPFNKVHESSAMRLVGSSGSGM